MQSAESSRFSWTDLHAQKPQQFTVCIHTVKKHVNGLKGWKILQTLAMSCIRFMFFFFFFGSKRKRHLKTVADEPLETEHVWKVHKQDVLALGRVPPSYSASLSVCLSHWIYVIAYSCVKCRPLWPRDKTLI